MCIAHAPAFAFTASASSAVSCSPVTSLTRHAPAASAAFAIAGREVSMDSGVSGIAFRSRSITGSTRSSSSCSLTAFAPGRVDWPPTSMRSAPAFTSATACASAAEGSRNFPPSENESGVTFTTPITYVRLPHSKRLPPHSTAGSGTAATSSRLSASASAGCSFRCAHQPCTDERE